MASRCLYCTVRFTVLVAIAPPLALLAVTITAEVPAGVPSPFGPGVGVGDGVLWFTPQPANSSKANPAEAVASRSFEFFVRASARASAVSPIKPRSEKLYSFAFLRGLRVFLRPVLSQSLVASG